MAWLWSVPSFVSSRYLYQLLFADVTAALHALRGLPLCLPLCNPQRGSCLLLSCLCSTSCWKACLSAINGLLLLAAVTTVRHMLEGSSLLRSTSCCCHNCAGPAETPVALQSTGQLLLHLLSLQQGLCTDRNDHAWLIPVSLQSLMLLCSAGLTVMIYRYEVESNQFRIHKV